VLSYPGFFVLSPTKSNLMPVSAFFIVLLIVASSSFFLGRYRAIASVDGNSKQLHSRPNYYGYYVALWTIVPALFIAGLWGALENNVTASMVLSHLPETIQTTDAAKRSLLSNDIRNLALGHIVGRSPEAWLIAAAEKYKSIQNVATTLFFALFVITMSVGFSWSFKRIMPSLRARTTVENFVKFLLLLCSATAILTTIGIVLSLIFESIRFFEKIPLTDFLFGLEWSPQTAIRADQVGSTGLFGVAPLFLGTLFISFIAMCVATPVGLMAAIYTAEYAPSKIRGLIKPILEILAGIPTVVYGFFAALTVAPFFRDAGDAVGFSISSESALVAGGVMGIMLIPFISSLSDDIIRAVPDSLREGSYGLGATQTETIRQVILPAALPGIVGSLILAASRAIGETMIVVMAAGLSANMTINPLEAVTTVTVQIVTLLVGDQEFDSAKTLAAFALGLLLFFVTLLLNVIALWVVNRYREQYD